MVITLSIIITCFSLIAINLYSVIREKRQVDEVRKYAFRRISGMEYDIQLIRDELLDLRTKYQTMASDPARQIDVATVDRRFRAIEQQLHNMEKQKGNTP